MDIASVLSIVSLGVGIVGGIIGIWERLKGRRCAEAMTLTSDTLGAVVTAIEMLPQNANTDKVKRAIQQVAETIGVEGPKLAGIVEQISDMVATYGVSGLKDAATLRAVAESARAKRKERHTPTIIFPLLLLCLLASGCAPHRYTREVVVPATADDPPEIVIQWPGGTVAADVITQTQSGVVYSSAPAPAEAP